ncbi:MAG TPA: hypothetical protein VNZ64_09310 [Candidatus Acidoferrum sp.]|nr:hypothetical protein [Candidatus Acidoferrum sp.]
MVDLRVALGDKRLADYDWPVSIQNLWRREAHRMIAAQIEFPLVVAVCAWCKPQNRAASIGTLSHGICLKHLRKLKLQARGLTPKRAARTGRESSGVTVPLLAL